MKFSNFIFWVFSLGVQLIETEGIQGGTIYPESELEHVKFVGSMIVPILDEKHRCTTILITELLAVTAGHCLTYDKRPSYHHMINFKRVVALVLMGTVRLNAGVRRRVKRGWLHRNFSRTHYPGMPAKRNYGALEVASAFSESNVVGFLPLVTNNIDRKYLYALRYDYIANCSLVSWGATTVLPLVENGLCNSISCGEEKLSRCSYEQNFFLKRLEVNLTQTHVCVYNYYPRAVDKYDREAKRSELHAALEKSGGAMCHLPKRPEANESTSIGDGGAPILCKYQDRFLFAGMHLSGRFQQYRTDGVHVLIPSFLMPFDVFENFMGDLSVSDVQGESPQKFIPLPVPFFISIVSMAFV